MTACLYCQKEVEPKEGKRAKKFCSNTCRASYYQKHKPKGPSRYVLRATHEQVVADLTRELKELKDKVRWANESPIDYRPATEQRFDAPKKNNYVQDEAAQWADPNRAEIQRLTESLLHPPKDLKGIDLTIWKRDVREKIEKLRITK